MLKEFGNEDRIKIYSCLGGTPHYLAQIDPRRTFEENIKRLYFDIAGYLYNEPMMLLRQELREPAMYNSIIGAIAGGASRINEIATKLGDDSSKLQNISARFSICVLSKKSILSARTEKQVAKESIRSRTAKCLPKSFRITSENRRLKKSADNT